MLIVINLQRSNIHSFLSPGSSSTSSRARGVAQQKSSLLTTGLTSSMLHANPQLEALHKDVKAYSKSAHTLGKLAEETITKAVQSYVMIINYLTQES